MVNYKGYPELITTYEPWKSSIAKALLLAIYNSFFIKVEWENFI